MDSSLPEWVTKVFFEQSLRKEENNNNIVVTNLTTSSAVPPGNNYGSFIIRVELEWKVDGNDSVVKTSRFIVKNELTEGPMKELATEFNLLEPSFYYNFIPKAKEYCGVNFAAKSFFSPKSTVTILEDLKEKGFVMADRTKLLDFDHCRLYMLAAASFHSVSVAVFKKHPEILQPIKKEIRFSNDSKVRELFISLINGGMNRFIREMEKLVTMKEFLDTVKDITPHLWDILVETHIPSGELIKTIKQGDPWIPNMMFRYDKNDTVCDIKIIDFQGTSYGSPISDLTTFLWSSANFDVKRNRLGDLYRIYLNSFNENLKLFNCDERLTYDQMMAEVRRFSPLALYISSSWLPGLVHPDPLDFSFFFSEDKESEVDKFFGKYYNDEYCAKFLPKVLESLEINGIFNNLVVHRK
ncbi:uncharacterized protein LOC128995182 [Macrosteles quadrilineatus]|uniref:uncharacterized protein LOC128995182 n=1 Tax=Macrosteles quadrilineatus TaxID=74068 RepID=UPI0023E25D48|nr:uncharacterized protein LOC128995182 [Macrosteles quadrilineatus]